MNYRKIFSFLALSFGISGLAFFLTRQLDLDSTFSLALLFVLAIVQLWGPGLAALIVQKRMYKGEMKDFGYRSGRLQPKWLATSILGPILALLGTVGVIFLMGNVLGFESFGRVVLAKAGSLAEGMFPIGYGSETSMVENLLGSLGIWETGVLANKWWQFFQLLLIFLVAGSTLLVPFVLGEELGWRGLLLKETQSLGFLGSGLVVGLAWGLWAILPLLMIGYWDPGILLVALGTSVAMSFPLSYLSLKTGSIFAPAIFRSVTALMGGLLGFFVISGEDHIASLGGLAGAIFFLFVTYLILLNDKQFVEDFPQLSYRKTPSDSTHSDQ
jgi:hypothetical protein